MVPRPWLLRLTLLPFLTVGILLLASAAPVAGHPHSQSPNVVVRFLNASDGDATWITMPDGSTVLIDCGPVSFGQKLATRLWAAGVSKISILALTNADPEAVGGCPQVLRALPVQRVIKPGPMTASTAGRHLESVLQELPAERTQEVVNGRGHARRFERGGAALEVLNPTYDAPQPLDEADDSLVLVLDFGPSRILFAGDVHARGEQTTVAALLLVPSSGGSTVPVTYLRIADHGSWASTSQGFLDQIEIKRGAIVSCGGARSGHAPDDRTLKRLSGLPLADGVASTAVNGDVVVQLFIDGAVKILRQYD